MGINSTILIFTIIKNIKYVVHLINESSSFFLHTSRSSANFLSTELNDFFIVKILYKKT